jgi:hypothetical protein
MKAFRKTSLILLCAMLMLCTVFSLASCNGNTDQNGDNNNNGNVNTDNTDNGNTDSDTEDENKLPDGQSLYTVLVIDQNGAPVSGVGVQLCSDAGCQMPDATGANGIVTFTTVTDNYKAQIANVPAGYVSPGSDVKFVLLNNSAIITIERSATYIVNVKDQFGNPVVGATVNHVGVNAPVDTNDSGVAIFECNESEGYRVFVTVPAGYEALNTVYTYSAGEKILNVTVNKISVITVIAEDAEGNKLEGAVVAVTNGKGVVVGYAVTGANGVARINVVDGGRDTFTATVIYLEGYTADQSVTVVDGYATVKLTAVA